MAGPLDLRGTATIGDGATSTLNKIRNGMDSVHKSAQRLATGGINGLGNKMAMGAAAAGGMMFGLVNASKEFNNAMWDANAAFLGGVKATDEAGMTKGLADSRDQAEELRKTALGLSRQFGLMPETFAKAGAEAAKMGLDFEKSKAVMSASGLIQMSDREADAATMAKALGTYGIIYGAEDDPAKYADQTKRRASMLALAGASTRTSASKIEEGMRNYMGMHGAFGGRFEDAVALIASGSQLGQMEKETGTSLKSLQGRFLNMPTGGRAALAGAGIDMKNFMDFGAADPMRATNQLISMFPQQLGKNARGSLLKFLESERATGGLSDPSIINKTVAKMEKLGLKFAGDQDRENAANKITSIMSGVGGKFDPLALISEIDKAIKEGRAGPNIWAAIGEPKRLHQYAGLMKIVNETLKLRNGLLEDGGRYLDLVSRGFKDSDAGKIVKIESSFRRLQLTLMRSDGIQTMVDTFGKMAEHFENLPTSVGNTAGSLMAFGVVAALTGVALAGIVGGFTALGTALTFLVANPIVLGIMAIVAAGVLLYQNWDTIANWFSSTWVGKMVSSFRTAADASKELNDSRFNGLAGVQDGYTVGGQLGTLGVGTATNDNGAGGPKQATLDININDTRTTAIFQNKNTNSPLFNRVNTNTGRSMGSGGAP